MVSPVFEQHYDAYLRQLAGLDLAALGAALGGRVEDLSGNTVVHQSYFNRPYKISSKGIARSSGQKAGYDTCIILCRYFIMARDWMGKNSLGDACEWVGFRDLKDSGPLTVYFRDNVEQVLSDTLSGQLSGASAICAELNAAAPDMDVSYDLALEIQALPMIPMLLLFNDAEEGFPASCSILFRAGVETFLDAECIAMLGYRLAAIISNPRRYQC